MPDQISIEDDLQRAIDILKSGGIVAFPTDTVYGLGASPLMKQAVRRIYEVKQRSLSQPLPLLLADASDLEKVALIVPPIAWQLVERFLPGGLTLVLLRSSWVPDIVASGGNSIAVRIPNHPVPLALIRGLGAPLVGTSANISGRSSPTTAGEVREQLGSQVELIIDGGRCPAGVDSTVLDLCGEVPVILREGAVSREEIAGVCGSVLQQ